MDESVLRVFNGYIGVIPGLWPLMSSPWAVVVLAVLAVFLARRAEAQRWLFPALIAVALSDITVSRVLKPAFERERPCAAVEGIRVPFEAGQAQCGAGYAMPSAHASNTMALAVAIASPELAVVSAFVGISRVITGQHWPSDVAAGWGWGLGVGTLLRFAFKKGLGWR